MQKLVVSVIVHMSLRLDSYTPLEFRACAVTCLRASRFPLSLAFAAVEGRRAPPEVKSIGHLRFSRTMGERAMLIWARAKLICPSRDNHQ